jgi:excisionase family DNA binding protein
LDAQPKRRESEPSQPDFLTVEEAARIFRVGRTAAYEQARLWEETDGERGLPVVRFGRLMRVPRAALERLIGAPLTTPQPKSGADRASRPRSRQLESVERTSAVDAIPKGQADGTHRDDRPEVTKPSVTPKRASRKSRQPLNQLDLFAPDHRAS